MEKKEWLFEGSVVAHESKFGIANCQIVKIGRKYLTYEEYYNCFCGWRVKRRVEINEFIRSVDAVNEYQQVFIPKWLRKGTKIKSKKTGCVYTAEGFGLSFGNGGYYISVEEPCEEVLFGFQPDEIEAA